MGRSGSSIGPRSVEQTRWADWPPSWGCGPCSAWRWGSGLPSCSTISTIGCETGKSSKGSWACRRWPKSLAIGRPWLDEAHEGVCPVSVRGARLFGPAPVPPNNGGGQDPPIIGGHGGIWGPGGIAARAIRRLPPGPAEALVAATARGGDRGRERFARRALPDAAVPLDLQAAGHAGQTRPGPTAHGGEAATADG